MKHRHWIALGLVASLALASLAAAQGEITRVYNLRNGAPADSLAGNATDTTASVPIYGAKMVTFTIRDSATTGSAYSDSLGGAALDVSYNGTAWHSINLNAFNISANDTLGIGWAGKLLSIPLSQNFTDGGNRAGALAVRIFPQSDPDGVAPYIQLQYARLRLQNQARKRHATSTENAALIGLRVRAWVVSGADPKTNTAP